MRRMKAMGAGDWIWSSLGIGRCDWERFWEFLESKGPCKGLGALDRSGECMRSVFLEFVRHQHVQRGFGFLTQRVRVMHTTMSYQIGEHKFEYGPIPFTSL